MKIIRVIVKELPNSCTECIFYIGGCCLLNKKKIECVYFEISYREEDCLLVKDRRLKRRKENETGATGISK